MTELVRVIVEGLGLDWASAQPRETSQDGTTRLELSLGLRELETLDGREHRTARAVRQVLSAAAEAGQRKLTLVAKARE